MSTFTGSEQLPKMGTSNLSDSPVMVGSGRSSSLAHGLDSRQPARQGRAANRSATPAVSEGDGRCRLCVELALRNRCAFGEIL